jgi:DsbE subfamily thiol:disulfide oxidoreductase
MPQVWAKDVPSNPVKTDTQSIDLHSLKGQVVYVDFWASWCGPCRKSFPWLNQMQAKYGAKGFKVIAVNVDNERKLADAFLKEHKAEFTIGYDPSGDLAKAFGVQGMPSSYLIDRQGVIRFSHVGFREKDVGSLEENIQSLIKE